MHTAELHDLMTRTRALAAMPHCPVHGDKHTAIRCGLCRADRNADHDQAALDDAQRIAAMHACDLLFPRRFRDALPNHPDVLDWVDTTIADPTAGASLLLLGPVGGGKTTELHGALRAVLAERPDLTWKATSEADFAASLRPRDGVDSETVLNGYRNADLFGLDDIGTAKASPWVEEITYRVVSHRYDQMLPAIYATNVPLEDEQDGRKVYPLRDALGDRITSRLAETCTQVVIDGPDRRRGLRAV